MNASGFIVRFVDVVLILLFGFITISNVRDTEITLPESTETEPVPLDVEEIIFVGVMNDGSYLVDDETLRISNLADAQRFLLQELERHGDAPVKVRIRSSQDAAVEYAFALAALCDQLGIPKSLEVEVDMSAG